MAQSEVQKGFVAFVEDWLRGRARESLSDGERVQLFDAADAHLRERFGVNLWDHLAEVWHPRDEQLDNDDEGFTQWKSVYASLEEASDSVNARAQVVGDYDGSATISMYCNSRNIEMLLEAIKTLKPIGKQAFVVRLYVEDDAENVVEQKNVVLQADQ